MKINPYLNFNGECEAAFKFYEQVFGGKITFIMSFADSPAAEMAPPDARHLIMHATLAIGDQTLQASDSLPGQYEPPQGIHISIHLKEVSQGERIFKALSEDGTVQMAFQQTFWAERFGVCVDRFGIPWLINCEKEVAS
jgi:PhnB protein